MFSVKSVELYSSWHWYAVEIEIDSGGRHVFASATLVERWDSNSDSHEWEVLSADPPELRGVVEENLGQIIAIVGTGALVYHWTAGPAQEKGGDPCEQSPAP